MGERLFGHELPFEGASDRPKRAPPKSVTNDQKRSKRDKVGSKKTKIREPKMSLPSTPNRKVFRANG